MMMPDPLATAKWSGPDGPHAERFSMCGKWGRQEKFLLRPLYRHEAVYICLL